MVHLKTLVLNNNFQPDSLFPLSVISAQNAFKKVFAGSATVVYNYSRKILTPRNHDFYYPSVIALNGYYARKIRVPTISKYKLLVRDNFQCQYCDVSLSVHNVTFDHLIPKSKGGKNTWDNFVASCQDCNARKGNKQIKGKWIPKNKPYVPTIFDLMDKRRKFPIEIYDERWKEFLYDWEGEIIVKGEK